VVGFWLREHTWQRLTSYVSPLLLQNAIAMVATSIVTVLTTDLERRNSQPIDQERVFPYPTHPKATKFIDEFEVFPHQNKKNKNINSRHSIGSNILKQAP